ncbi:elongation factor G [Christensenella sp. MSJ-20]|uniref:elongation factor G n=1 Tax=Christensenella sp. MSJ-20 TaxID=2841518 RepID=UPI001C746EDD|nr:elongation factor G [Christensenella sp. MSJ-20]
MKNYNAQSLRNVAIVGHGSEGKTTLTEAIMFNAGLIDRMGKVEDGNTVSDYDAEEIRRGISISASLAPVEHKDVKINFIDAPGYFDFVGEMVQAMHLADSALIVVGAMSGIAVGTEKAWDMCEKKGMPRMIFVNQMDREHADYQKVFHELKEKYGTHVAPIACPILEGGKITGYVDIVSMKAYRINGKAYAETEIPGDLADFIEECREALVEAAAETDDALLEKFFGGEELSEEEIISGLRTGINQGQVAPMLGGAAAPNLLIAPLVDAIVKFLPSPADRPAVTVTDVKSGEEIALSCDESAPFAAQVIKTVADPFVGKLSIFRVYSGSLKGGSSFLNVSRDKTEKVGSISSMRGKKQVEMDRIIAGDIGAIAKLQNTGTGDSICDPARPVRFADMEFPAPCISMAVNVMKEGEEDKVFGGLVRLEEEDPTFELEKTTDTIETLIKGMGELHLEVIIKKLENKFGVSAKLSEPKVAYRETIRKAVKAEGRHKKQSGGHGQFGHCWIEFEPLYDGQDFEFVDKVVGGVVPRQFIPAVEKGLRENLSRGVLAGYPIVGIRATLYDGSYHAVDSSEMAFKTAARLALRKGCSEANPVLLEPIYKVNVQIPDEYMGDIIGDMNRRRGRIMGMNPLEGGLQEVMAEVPQAEMFRYATDLRSMTQARGTFDMTFERYEEVPSNIAQKIIENAKIEEDED